MHTTSLMLCVRKRHPCASSKAMVVRLSTSRLPSLGMAATSCLALLMGKPAFGRHCPTIPVHLVRGSHTVLDKACRMQSVICMVEKLSVKQGVIHHIHLELSRAESLPMHTTLCCELPPHRLGCRRATAKQGIWQHASPDLALKALLFGVWSICKTKQLQQSSSAYADMSQSVGILEGMTFLLSHACRWIAQELQQHTYQATMGRLLPWPGAHLMCWRLQRAQMMPVSSSGVCLLTGLRSNAGPQSLQIRFATRTCA